MSGGNAINYDCIPQIEWSISIETFHFRRQHSNILPFVKVKPPKYIISPPSTSNDRNLTNVVKNNDNYIDDEQEENSPCSQKYSYLYQKKISALLKNKGVEVPLLFYPNSAKSKTQRNTLIGGASAYTPLERIHLSDGRFVPQYPSSTDDEEKDSKSPFVSFYGNGKNEHSKRSDSISKYSSADINTSSSQGKTWNGSSRSAYETKSNNNSIDKDGGEGVNVNRKENTTSNRKEESGGSRSPIETPNNDSSIPLTNEVAFGGKRDRRWYRKNLLPICLPRGVSSNINLHACLESTTPDKPSAADSNKMSIDPFLNYKDEVLVFASTFVVEIVPSEEDKGKSKKGQNQVKSLKQVEKLKSKKVSRRKKKTKKRTIRGDHRKDKDETWNKHSSKPLPNDITARNRKNVSNNRPSNKQPTQRQMVDMSSNIMAIRHLEILSLARAERESYNYREFLAWMCLLGFVLFVLLYRSEIC